QTVLVQPYVQPGDGRLLTGTDVKVLCWWTDQKPADFVVEYDTPSGSTPKAKPVRLALDFPVYTPPPNKEGEIKKLDPNDPRNDRIAMPPETEQHYFKYTAQLDGLPFNSTIAYRVKLGERVIRQASFRTRATADKAARCVLVGDLAYALPKERAVAY